MSNTPKPSPVPKQEGGNVFPLERRSRREPTQEFDRKSGETRLPGTVSRRDDTPTDVMPIPDGRPPGEAQEMVVELTKLATHTDPLDALEEMTFVAGTVIRDATMSRGHVYYEILTGYADMGGVQLKTGDFIGLVEFTPVHATHPLHVRVYDLSKIAASGNQSLRIVAQSQLLKATSELANLERQDNAKLREQLASATTTVGILEHRVTEYDAHLRGRLEEVIKPAIRKFKSGMQGEIDARDFEIRALRERVRVLQEWKDDALVWIPEQIRQKDERIAELEEWVQAFFGHVAELQETIQRMHIDRVVDAQSLTLSLDALIDEGVVDASEKRIAELVSIAEEALALALILQDEPALSDIMKIRQKAMHAQSALFTFKMNAPKDFVAKKPAT